VVDCGALPENLLESELFGHAKGAFTGAAQSRGGAFECADRGTVFLDEIGEMPLSMQPKLLRVLESRTVRRLGESHQRPVQIRIVSATHRDLRTMVNAGTFREDLYFRLAVLPIMVPPLRDRLEDIPDLARSFLGDAAALSPELVGELAKRPWLGNVRELRNFVARARVLGAADALAGDVPSSTRGAGTRGTGESFPDVDPSESFREIRTRWLDHLEREYVKKLMATHQGNISAVGKAAGLDRTYIYRLIRKHDL
jgi:transcriptional regulator with PAS, ATPase and Fis domain